MLAGGFVVVVVIGRVSYAVHAEKIPGQRRD
jgi:hypothetical protein